MSDRLLKYLGIIVLILVSVYLTQEIVFNYYMYPTVFKISQLISNLLSGGLSIDL